MRKNNQNRAYTFIYTHKNFRTTTWQRLRQVRKEATPEIDVHSVNDVSVLKPCPSGNSQMGIYVVASNASFCRHLQVPTCVYAVANNVSLLMTFPTRCFYPGLKELPNHDCYLMFNLSRFYWWVILESARRYFSLVLCHISYAWPKCFLCLSIKAWLVLVVTDVVTNSWPSSISTLTTIISHICITKALFIFCVHMHHHEECPHVSPNHDEADVDMGLHHV